MKSGSEKSRAGLSISSFLPLISSKGKFERGLDQAGRVPEPPVWVLAGRSPEGFREGPHVLEWARRPFGQCLAWKCRAVGEALAPQQAVFDGLHCTAQHWGTYLAALKRKPLFCSLPHSLFIFPFYVRV